MKRTFKCGRLIHATNAIIPAMPAAKTTAALGRRIGSKGGKTTNASIPERKKLTDATEETLYGCIPEPVTPKEVLQNAICNNTEGAE